MNGNPYESPVADETRPSQAKPSHLFVWFSSIIVILLMGLYTFVLFSTWNDFPNLRYAGLRQIIQFLILLGIYSMICGGLPFCQFVSVYRQSIIASKCAYWLSTIAMGFAIVMVPVYPLVECCDPDLRGTEIVGAIGFGTIAVVFFLNRRFHDNWIATLQRPLQSAS